MSGNRGFTATLTFGLIVGITQVASSARAQTITACVNKKNGAVSLISKGTCNTKTTTSVVVNPTSIQTLTVQTLNVVDANNHTVATLGKNANGNLLTFFDSNGKQTLTLGNDATETFAGLETFDGNNVIAGDGIARTIFGEINTADALGSAFNGSDGFGGEVFDAGNLGRVQFGLQDTANDSYLTAVHSNATSAQIGAFQSQSFAGYNVKDLNGTVRQTDETTLDGTGNFGRELDSNGQIRVVMRQTTATVLNAGFSLFDQNQLSEAEVEALPNGSESAFILFDTNQMDRFLAKFSSQNGSEVETLEANGDLNGLLF